MAKKFSFKNWYAVNGDRLNAQRKHRYHNDPAYRAQVLAVNRASRERLEEARLKRTRLLKRTPRTVIRQINGVEETLYSIGAVAEELGCSVQSIRLWERQGLIPATPLRDESESSKGHRLYTIAMIYEIRRILKSHGKLVAPRQYEKAKAIHGCIRKSDGQTQVVDLYLVGTLASALNRRVSTIIQLEGKGLFPSTPFRAEVGNRRLFTMSMIEAAEVIFSSFNETAGPRGEKEWSDFSQKVLVAWEAQGLKDAVLLKDTPMEVSNG